MIVTYHGDNYFKIQAQNRILLIDPTNHRSFKGADIILNTLRPALTAEPEDGFFWIDHQGEYEIKDICIQGWSLGEENKKEKTVYKIQFDEITIGILGYISKTPDKKIEEELASSEILIIPAHGLPYLDIPATAKLIKRIRPSIVIPSLAANLKPFLKEFDQEKCELEEKLVVKNKELKPNAMIIRCLKY